MNDSEKLKIAIEALKYAVNEMKYRLHLLERGADHLCLGDLSVAINKGTTALEQIQSPPTEEQKAREFYLGCDGRDRLFTAYASKGEAERGRQTKAIRVREVLEGDEE